MTQLEEDLVRLYRETRVDGDPPAAQSRDARLVASGMSEVCDKLAILLQHHGLNPDQPIPGETARAKSRATK